MEEELLSRTFVCDECGKESTYTEKEELEEIERSEGVLCRKCLVEMVEKE